MTDARLPAGLEAAAVRRSVEAQGGFAAILHKGDADRGALLLLVRERGAFVTMLERALENGGETYRWRRCGPASGCAEDEIGKFLSSRLRFDSDCWVIELDVPASERFVVETLAAG